jgi:pyruvate/2-oxoglutarate dehydrogenase complex dihydrolipoamide acyltransferase (E2) component
MAFEFKLPDVGEGITEGEIIRWLVAAGDIVTQDQPLVEVQTDKAVVELPSPRAGRILECRGEPGQVIAVGTTLAVIGDTEETAAVAEEMPPPGAPARPPAPVSVTRETSPAPTPPRLRVQAAPATRRLARELGIDLAEVSGSGPHGRVVPADVRRAAHEDREPAPTTPLTTPGAGGRTEVKLIGLRRVISEHMAQSWREIPHVTVVEKARASELKAIRERLKEAGEARGVRVTYLPLVAKALTLAIRDYPVFNARWEEGRLFQYADVHLGLAMDTPEGLVVPVVRGAQDRSVLEIAGEAARLAAGARERRLSSSELTGSTVTITGGGPLEGLFATPIINYPEVAILGMYRLRDEAWVVDGRLEPAPSLYLSLTFDHRVADGAEASRFLRRLIGLLEDPAVWLLDLR